MENDNFIIGNMTWSFSRISSFGDGCRYEWKKHYIDCEETSNSCYGEFGSWCHKLLEMFLKGELNEFELAQEYVDGYADNVTTSFPANIGDTCYEKGLRYFENFSFDRDKYEILGVEKKVEFKIGKYDCIGFIDALLRDKETGEIIILDHKSSTIKVLKNGKISKGDQAHFENFKRQLYLYSIPILEEYGSVSRLIWNMFKDGTKIEILWKKDEFEATKKWAQDTIESIEKEEEFPAKPDYFYCMNLCNIRNNVYCPYKRLGMIYDGIYSKCYSPKNKFFEEYGGQNIGLCEDWKNNKQEFFSWALENGYQDDLVLKRYDETGDFDFFNCYWGNKEVSDEYYGE